jgi:guanylate kinase
VTVTELKPGRLIVISSPSGGGKTTVVERLLAEVPQLVRSVSYTTRPPRQGEISGRDYIFLSQSEFEAKARAHFFLEYADVYGFYYGTSRDRAEDLVRRGFHVILTIDVQGMKQVRANTASGQKVLTIFLMPPSTEELKRRLQKRMTDSDEMIERRLAIAQSEMKQARDYDYVVQNTDLKEAIRNVKEILK